MATSMSGGTVRSVPVDKHERERTGGGCGRDQVAADWTPRDQRKAAMNQVPDPEPSGAAWAWRGPQSCVAPGRAPGVPARNC